MNTSHMVIQLQAAGWTEVMPDWEYRKGNWIMARDTSSWWMAGTRNNPRVYDLHEPNEDEARWVVGLVEHLCKMEDERVRLRAALSQIDERADLDSCRAIAARALQTCYHNWLCVIGTDKSSCPICGQTKTRENPNVA